MKRIACIGIGLALFLGMLGRPASAQNQTAQNQAQSNPAPSNAPSPSSGSSLGDYARQVRKNSAPKSTPKVFDNDNLPTEDKLSIVGPAAGTAAGSATEAKAEEPAGAAPAAAKALTGDSAQDDAAKQAAWKQWSDKIAAQKDQIDLLTRELNVLQKEYQMRAAAMYADVGNRLRNETDWDKQDAQFKQQIADKQKALDDAQQKLTDLQEDARKAGVPSSVAEP